jgi:hypothetical protein
MDTVQLGIGIPANLNQRLTDYIERTGLSKTWQDNKGYRRIASR